MLTLIELAQRAGDRVTVSKVAVAALRAGIEAVKATLDEDTAAPKRKGSGFATFKMEPGH